jgi:hypothetical protein
MLLRWPRQMPTAGDGQSPHPTIWRETFPNRKILPDNDSPQPDIKIDDEASNKRLRGFKKPDWGTLKENVIANVQEVL